MDSKASTVSGPAPGRFGKLLIRMFMKQVPVTDVETVAESFRLVTLESPQFKGIAWSPGQKVQIATGSAFVARTFTPIEWDAVAGRTRILGYLHGQGPGNDWLHYLRVGDACDVFGPRASLDVSHLTSMPVVFGDETSIGLLCALAGQYPLRRARFLLEVNEAGTAAKVLTRMGIDEVELFERTPGDTHLADIETRLPALVALGETFLLTGKASSIQRLGRRIKALGASGPRLLSKPYWAVGREGLD